MISKLKIQIIKDKNPLEFSSWPIWECEPSTFNWEYEEEEHCYIIEGIVEVTTNEEEFREWDGIEEDWQEFNRKHIKDENKGPN